MKPLVLVPQFFGSLVFDRRTSRYLPFDRDATELLVALATRTVDEVLAAERERRDAIRAFWEAFYERGFFRLDGRFDAEIRRDEPPPDHLLGPLAVHLEVVGACNLQCAHCFAAPLPRNDGALSLSEIDGLLRELAAMGAFRLGLTGGEPLLRKDLLEIVDAARAHGLHPCLTTNALLVDDRIARELGKREWAWLNVSLDGATRESNDAVRGAGTFDRVMEKLAILRRHARFTLAFTITSANHAEVLACAKLAREAGASTAVFRPVYPAGAALARRDLMPSYEEYADALVTLGRSADVRAADPFSPQAREATQARVFLAGCGAANSVASVSVRGDVSPCSFLGDAFLAGNVRDRSFAEIWHHSPVFERLRRAERGFAGGCRARALAEHGDADAPDPWEGEWRSRTLERAGPRDV